MFEKLAQFFKKNKKEASNAKSRDTAKERLHLVLMQDRANVSADFLDLMRQEIIEVIKKYIDVDDNAIDVRLTNQENEDGTQGAPALYANIPIINIKEKAKNASKEIEKKLDNEKQVSQKENSNNQNAEQVNTDNNTDDESENEEMSNDEEKQKSEDLEQDVKKQAEEKIEEAKRIEEKIIKESEDE